MEKQRRISWKYESPLMLLIASSIGKLKKKVCCHNKEVKSTNVAKKYKYKCFHVLFHFHTVN